jgi:hypothetical protein
MTEPRDQSQRGFEPERPPEGANRFWQQYASARPHRAPRDGENGRRAADERDSRAVPDHECLDWCPICRGADVVRATAPPEIREQLQAFQRDALSMLRTLIDAYLARLESRPDERGRGRVEEIRID